jgi:hypothetical protein
MKQMWIKNSLFFIAFLLALPFLGSAQTFAERQAALDSMPRMNASGALLGAPVTTWTAPFIVVATSDKSTLTQKLQAGLVPNGTTGDSVVSFTGVTPNVTFTKVARTALRPIISTQVLSITGQATSWNSVIECSPSADMVITLPTISGTDINAIGQEITIRRTNAGNLSATQVTPRISVVAASGQSVDISSLNQLMTQNGSVTFRVITSTKSSQKSASSKQVICDYNPPANSVIYQVPNYPEFNAITIYSYNVFRATDYLLPLTAPVGQIFRHYLADGSSVVIKATGTSMASDLTQSNTTAVMFIYNGTKWDYMGDISFWTSAAGVLANKSHATINIDGASTLSLGTTTPTTVIGNTLNTSNTVNIRSGGATSFQFGTGGQVQMANNGMVGIGTSTPISALSNNANNTLGSNGVGVGATGISWATATSGYAATLFNSNTGGGLAVKAPAGSTILDLSAGAVQGTSGTSVMKVEASGNVGIGTSTPTSTLHNSGSFAQGITNTSLAAYTATATDNIIFLNLAGAQTLTLPTASTCIGRTYIVKNPTNFMKTISPNYTNNDGVGFSHVLEGEDFELISDGSAWRKIGGYNETVTKSIYMANGAWNAKTVSIGGLEFIINGTTSGAGRVIQVRTTDGTSKSLTQNCTRFISGSYSSGEAPSNSAVPTTYTSLHTATTDIAGNYYKTILDITNRATGVGSDNWVVTTENDGSINLLIRVQYTKSR